MKDLIDEKNKQEKMKRSVIKYWNVSYGTPEAIGGEEEENEREHATDTYPQENYGYDEASELKQAEIEAIDEVSQTKIQQILHEKDDRLHNLIEHEQHEIEEVWVLSEVVTVGSCFGGDVWQMHILYFVT